MDGAGEARSPAVGYFSPARGLVVGQSVSTGDTLGSVDVLGIAQEVTAPVDGIVSALLAETGQAVEYGQVLVEIDPLGDELDALKAARLPSLGRQRSGGTMIGRVLIANRGEIAVRILRACRSMGIEAVVAHSEADRDSRAVMMADEAICIGPPESSRSYLSAAAVISAALVSGCDAIHPGYGFLSEDDAFAEMTRAHDLVFIGPSAEVLERFASKAGTRQLLARHGLPVVPGSEGMLRDDEHALAEAERIGYPLLIKPSAGGGGKGMRLARTARELQQALTVCRSEARAAFGDDSLYLEKWLERTRHVEVQVIIDELRPRRARR